MPQPIDFQSELGRVTAAERVQQINDRLSLAAQHKATEEMQQQRLETETQVQQPHAQNEQVEQDTRRRNPFMGRRHHQQADDEQSVDAEQKPHITASPEEGQQLDVTI